MLRAPAFLYRLVDNEIGATMVEYGLMASLIAAACMATVSLIGTNMSAMFTMIAGTI